jgi:hypothetical protein
MISGLNIKSMTQFDGGIDWCNGVLQEVLCFVAVRQINQMLYQNIITPPWI